MMVVKGDRSSDQSNDARIKDYLNDKLRFSADLNSLDELIADVETQRAQLQSQLDDAVKDFDLARQAAEGGPSPLAARIEEFHQLQESIDRRNEIAASSDAPAQAVARLKKPIEQVEKITLGIEYLRLIQNVCNMRDETKRLFANDRSAALAKYTELKDLTVYLRSLEAGDGLHLVDHVETTTAQLWGEMRESLSAELEGVLNKNKWPKVDPELEMDEDWMSAFEQLIDLQLPEMLHARDTTILLPIEIMSRIFVSEFRFHFLSDKKTSDPRAVASHCFPWFIALIEKWQNFFHDNLFHLLIAKFETTPMAKNANYVDPVCALVMAMLPVMREKIWDVITRASQKPAILSTIIPELVIFDETIRTKFRYDGGDAENGWPGLTSEVLDKHFEEWFQAQREFAMKRFRAFLNAEDAHRIDYDHAVEGKMKPTFAAVRIMELLGQVTKQYEPLRKHPQKVRFLLDIQIDILDAYHERLRDSLEAYQSATSKFGRRLHSVTSEQIAALEGTGALETLSKVIGSSDYVVNTLKDWDDEDFFIALWDEMQSRKAEKSRTAPADASDEDAWIEDSPVTLVEDGHTLFEETISAYRTRCSGAQDLLVGALDTAHREVFRFYASRTHFTTLGDTTSLDDNSQLTVSPHLVQPLETLRQNFKFLLRILSTSIFRLVWRRALGSLAELLQRDVLLKQSFSSFGATQFKHDVAAIFSLVDSFIPGGSAALPVLRDSVILLTLPDESEDEDLPSFGEASSKAFTSNEDARSVLEKLHLTSLTPALARSVLERRIENSESSSW